MRKSPKPSALTRGPIYNSLLGSRGRRSRAVILQNEKFFVFEGNRKMIIVTGAAGFIGSALIARLNKAGHTNIVAVDRLGSDERWKNLVGLKFSDYLDADDFADMIDAEKFDLRIKALIHLGACSSTTETDAEFLIKNNYEYSKKMAVLAIQAGGRFIYASSAATYGDGANGFSDDEKGLWGLGPLNMYGYSKHLFDLWAKNNNLLNEIVGLKYFNVFGPNEYHKAEMRSFAMRAFEQITETGKVKLFKSYNPDYKDGGQIRDFIYVKDAVDMTLFFLENKKANGIFNIGTGKPRTWLDLANAVFAAMNKQPDIEYIDMPGHLKSKYQYFTKAETQKIQTAGYKKEPASLEETVKDYVQNYLAKGNYLAGENFN